MEHIAMEYTLRADSSTGGVRARGLPVFILHTDNETTQRIEVSKVAYYWKSKHWENCFRIVLRLIDCLSEE